MLVQVDRAALRVNAEEAVMADCDRLAVVHRGMRVHVGGVAGGRTRVVTLVEGMAI